MFKILLAIFTISFASATATGNGTASNNRRRLVQEYHRIANCTLKAVSQDSDQEQYIKPLDDAIKAYTPNGNVAGNMKVFWDGSLKLDREIYNNAGVQQCHKGSFLPYRKKQALPSHFYQCLLANSNEVKMDKLFDIHQDYVNKSRIEGKAQLAQFWRDTSVWFGQLIAVDNFKKCLNEHLRILNCTVHAVSQDSDQEQYIKPFDDAVKEYNSDGDAGKNIKIFVDAYIQVKREINNNADVQQCYKGSNVTMQKGQHLPPYVYECLSAHSDKARMDKFLDFHKDYVTKSRSKGKAQLAQLWKDGIEWFNELFAVDNFKKCYIERKRIMDCTIKAVSQDSDQEQYIEPLDDAAKEYNTDGDDAENMKVFWDGYLKLQEKVNNNAGVQQCYAGSVFTIKEEQDLPQYFYDCLSGKSDEVKMDELFDLHKDYVTKSRKEGKAKIVQYWKNSAAWMYQLLAANNFKNCIEAAKQAPATIPAASA